MPGARITNQLYRSELRQAGFSCDFYYPPRIYSTQRRLNRK